MIAAAVFFLSPQNYGILNNMIYKKKIIKAFCLSLKKSLKSISMLLKNDIMNGTKRIFLNYLVLPRLYN